MCEESGPRFSCGPTPENQSPKHLSYPKTLNPPSRLNPKPTSLLQKPRALLQICMCPSPLCGPAAKTQFLKPIVSIYLCGLLFVPKPNNLKSRNPVKPARPPKPQIATQAPIYLCHIKVELGFRGLLVEGFRVLWGLGL